MASIQWIPLKRQYDNERQAIAKSKQAITAHPLLAKTERLALEAAAAAGAPPPPGPPQGAPSKGVPASAKPTTAGRGNLVKISTDDPFSDPLNPLSPAAAPRVALDPLSDPLSSMSLGSPTSASSGGTGGANNASSSNPSTPASNTKASVESSSTSADTSIMALWNKRKAQVLVEYAVTGNLTLSSAAVSEFAGSGVEDGSSTRRVDDKYTQRLQSLERRAAESAGEKVTMTQKEYEAHLAKLEEDLQRAWSRDERVLSLKIAIQISKLLADTNMISYYPIMFVFVTSALQRFSDMVFVRLRNKADEGLQQASGQRSAKLPDNFTSDQVPAGAKETTRNWFYKTACIRELLPRVYIEVTLLRCYRFLSDSDYPTVLSKLASIIRGLGDPLVATYARSYLTIMASQVVDFAAGKVPFVVGMLQDTFATFKMFSEPSHQDILTKHQLKQRDYLRSLSPAVELLCQCVGRAGSKELFQSFLLQFREQVNDSMVLMHTIDSFDANYYAHAYLGMVALIKSTDPANSSATYCDVFAVLGKQVLAVPPPEDQRLALLNEVWKTATKSEDLGSYVRCCLRWIEAVQKHYSERETLVLLSDLSAKLQIMHTTGDLPESIANQLDSIVGCLITEGQGISNAVLTSEALLKILDVCKGPKKVLICMDIFSAMQKSKEPLSDVILMNTLFYLGRILHDSVDSLSDEGERKEISKLLSSFVQSIDFGKDLEQQLNMYVECRRTFCNLDLVIERIILCVASLTTKAYRFVKGKHNKKTGAFVKGCLAFCHITIPSIGDVMRKLQLLLHCAQVSLLNQCLPQTDTFLKAAISLIPELTTHEEVDGRRVHTEEKLYTYTRCLLSTLVVAPGHPEHGPFYIVNGLLNALPKYPWQALNDRSGSGRPLLCKVYIQMLPLLATYAQRRFPYRIPQVESNDDLYGGAPGYMRELYETLCQCIEEIVKELTAIGEAAANADTTSAATTVHLSQSRLIFEFVSHLVESVELSADVSAFIVKLLELANKHKSVFTKADLRQVTLLLEALRSKAASSDAQSTLLTALRNFQ